jgi:hypothetical protein
MEVKVALVEGEQVEVEEDLEVEEEPVPTQASTYTSIILLKLMLCHLT